MKVFLKILLVCVLLITSCIYAPYRVRTRIIVHNSSDVDISVTWPCERDIKRIPGYNLVDTSYTTQYFYLSESQVFKGESRIYGSTFDTFEEWIPQNHDFVSIFILRYSLAPYKINDGTEVIEDSYLVRYDLSINDIHSLCNKRGELEISYPPDERMKDIKMWPIYEDVMAGGTNEINEDNKKHREDPAKSDASIRSVSFITYTYDAAGNRIGRSSN